MRLKRWAALCAAGFAVFVSAPTRANSILLDTLVTPNPSVVTNGTNYNWAYTVLVTNSSHVETGDYFVIVDFAGYVGPISQPAGWAFSVANTSSPVVGDPGYSSSAPDSPSVPNLVWTYTGLTDFKGQVGPFIAESIYWIKAPGSLLAVNHGETTNGGVVTVQHITNNNTILVPSAVVPLPAAVWSSASLLGLIGLARLRRFAKS